MFEVRTEPDEAATGCGAAVVGSADDVAVDVATGAAGVGCAVVSFAGSIAACLVAESSSAEILAHMKPAATMSATTTATTMAMLRVRELSLGTSTATAPASFAPVAL